MRLRAVALATTWATSPDLNMVANCPSRPEPANLLRAFGACSCQIPKTLGTVCHAPLGTRSGAVNSVIAQAEHITLVIVLPPTDVANMCTRPWPRQSGSLQPQPDFP